MRDAGLRAAPHQLLRPPPQGRRLLRKNFPSPGAPVALEVATGHQQWVIGERARVRGRCFRENVPDAVLLYVALGYCKNCLPHGLRQSDRQETTLWI